MRIRHLEFGRLITFAFPNIFIPKINEIVYRR